MTTLPVDGAPRAAPRILWREVGLWLWCVFVIGMFLFVIPVGVPGLGMLFVLTVLLNKGFDGGLRQLAVTFRGWTGVVAFVIAYTTNRGVADSLGMPIQQGSMIAIDRVIGFGELPTHRVQRWIDWDAAPKWWEVSFPVVYASHFIASMAPAAVLYQRNRDRCVEFVSRWLLLSAIGLVGYILLPTVPPWMASELGTVATVHEGLARGWEAVSIPAVSDVFTFGRNKSNQIAAMPSLHCGYPALLFLFFAPGRRRLVQVALGFYALFMAFTVVITGQHWVIDILAGWACAWVAHRAVGRIRHGDGPRPSDLR